MIIKETKKVRVGRTRWGMVALLLGLIALPIYFFFPILGTLASDRVSEAVIEQLYPGSAVRCRYPVNGCGASLRDAVWLTAVSEVRRLFGLSDVPRLNIELDFESLEKIKADRAEAMKLGYLLSSDDDFVEGAIQYQDKRYPVELRLKGSQLDHFDDSAIWSYRVHVKDDEAIMGMSRFSLQHPKTRGYQYEAIYHDIAGDLGLIAPRYSFADVSLNGERLGIMAIEEYFSKELAENRERRDGVLLQFDDSVYVEGWMGWQRLRDADPDVSGARRRYCNDLFTADIIPFRANQVSADQEMSRQRDIGMARLRALTAGELAASEVFDADKTALFIANALAWRSYHNLHWMNLRFYLDPITLKLEPIAFDGDLTVFHDLSAVDDASRNLDASVYQHETWADTFGMDLIRILLSDPTIMDATVDALGGLRARTADGNFVAEYQVQDKEYLRILQPDYPFLPPVVFNTWQELDETIAALGRLDLDIDAAFEPLQDGERFVLPELPRYVNAHILNDADGAHLELVNILDSDVLIDGLQISVNGAPQTLAGHVDAAFPVRIARTGDCAEPTSVLIRLKGVVPGDSIEVTGNVRVLAEDGGAGYPFTATPYAAPSAAHALEPIDVAALRRYPFLSVSQDDRVIKVAAGRWQVDRFLVLPVGYGLDIAAGTTLAFAPEAGLIVNGRVRIEGTPEAPVVLEPADTGRGWKGLTVLDANRYTDMPSVLRNAEISGASAAEYGDWKITGGVTFYGSDIDLEDCRISGSLAEDSLNIVRSAFTFNGVTISDARSDGLDSDFSSGVIADSAFSDIAGDGADFSGSEVTVVLSSFTGIGDKALSVGERSEVKAEGITVDGARFGFVSKDDSSLQAKDSDLKAIAQYALAAYQKKPEYGGASLVAEGITYQGEPRDVIAAQDGSIVTIDGGTMPERSLDIDAIYATGLQ